MSGKKHDFDLLVIGGGSGGVRAARWAAGLGVRVALCESHRFGGTCVLKGCIPKKLMLAASELPGELQYFSSYGWEVSDYKLHWQVQKQMRDKELKRLEGIYENLLLNKQVQILKGHGKITAPHKVCVGGQTYTARFILIAVGAKPFMLPVTGQEHFLSSDDVFEMTTKPSSLFIVGSGYIGLEFASIFNNFGTKVHLLSRRKWILRGFDQDVREFLQTGMVKSGVNILTEDTVSCLRKVKNQIQVECLSGAKYLVDKVLCATGRKPSLDSLGLDQVGVEVNSSGEIKVNPHYETSIKGIYALGDCADTSYQLTPVATAEAVCLVEHLFAGSERVLNYDFIPTAVFTHPPVATVGLTEQQALEKKIKTRIYTSEFRPLKYTVTELSQKTFMKIVVNQDTDQVCGVHIVGQDAPEMIQGFAVALKAGAKKSDFDKTLGVHPTSAEELVTMRQSR